MAEKDLESEKLELSLFGRKRRKGGKKAADGGGATAADAPPEQGEVTSEPPRAAQAAGFSERTETSAPLDPPRPSEPVDPPTTDSRPVATGTATTTPVATQTQAPGAGEDTTVLPTAGATTVKGGRRARGGVGKRGGAAGGGGARVARKPSSRSVRIPTMSAPLAALAVGALVGLAAVALTFASLKACDVVAGTDSCGGPGLLVLLAVVVLMILGGKAALSMLGVPESGGLSFLGVAMFVAICLVVLLPNLLEPWMILVAPLLCALTFLAAHWIVTRFDEEILEPDGPAPYDIR